MSRKTPATVTLESVWGIHGEGAGLGLCPRRRGRSYVSWVRQGETSSETRALSGRPSLWLLAARPKCGSLGPAPRTPPPHVHMRTCHRREGLAHRLWHTKQKTEQCNGQPCRSTQLKTPPHVCPPPWSHCPSLHPGKSLSLGCCLSFSARSETFTMCTKPLHRSEQHWGCFCEFKNRSSAVW